MLRLFYEHNDRMVHLDQTTDITVHVLVFILFSISSRGKVKYYCSSRTNVVPAASTISGPDIRDQYIGPLPVNEDPSSSTPSEIAVRSATLTRAEKN